MRILSIALLLSCTSFTIPAMAQDTGNSEALPETTEASKDDDAIIVTGSSIKRRPTDSAVPLQIFTISELQRDSISSPEQFVSLLASNGNGADNLSSNADITSGAQRGTNGVSSANLRNQGSGATLVLLNGRRVASHGLGGGAVDVNQIPFSALERVEVLKDGASAIYGTDAIGGVINFITRKDYTGLGVTGFIDKTQQGGGDIYKGSVTAGAGNLDNDGFNIMVSGSYSENKILRGTQRDFVTTNLPSFGLSADTRGTPFATVFTNNGTLLTTANAPFIPGSTTARFTAINTLDLPGAAGCSSVAGMFAYDDVLWGSPSSAFACAYETGKPAVLQQPLQTLTFLARGVARLGDNEISLEYTRSDSDSAKSFSEVQISNNTSSQQLRYPSTGAGYNRVVSELQAAFPTATFAVGSPIAYRWRCLECGPRTIETSTQASRIFLNAQGPLFAGWDYRTGASYAESSSTSQLGAGYYFRGTTASGANDPLAPTAPGATNAGIIGLLNSGQINVFLRPGETQTAAALSALQTVSAEGTVLYGGKFGVTQIDGAFSGPLFALPGGMAKAAVGVDYRREAYSFNGDARAAAARPTILAAPFDDAFALASRARTIKAAYAELLLPIVNSFELNLAVRRDEYTGFGATTNPKISFRYQPISQIAMRGSYNTGFRVPSFNQIFNGTLESPLPGADLADPRSCPGGRPISGVAGCAVINPNVLSGGNLNVGPEKAKQYGLGFVFTPSSNFSATVDWWKITRSGAITTLSVRELVNNFTFFEDRFIRDGAGTLIQIDQRVVNAGRSFTQGVDVALRGSTGLAGGRLGFAFDGTYLLEKLSQLVPSVPVSASEVGKFTFSGDLGLKWKHNAYITYGTGDFDFSVSQLFRSGYKNNAIGQVGSGAITRPDVVDQVKDYITYNLSASYKGIRNFQITAGINNLFDTDPPFAITYDTDTGAGSSWEPRVANPRGRAFTLLASFKF
jgi:iron complex outermembrane recepter protein